MEFTRDVLRHALVLLCLFASGCGVQILDGQDIEINVHDTTEQNLELAQALLLYDPRHWAEHIPALNQDGSQDIRFQVNESPNGGVIFHVIYDLSYFDTTNDQDELEAQFARYVQQLAAAHAAHEPVFLELAPQGIDWADGFFTGDLEQLLKNSSPVLSEMATLDQIAAARDGMLREYGTPQRITYLYGQYYAQSDDDEPETITLMYSVDTDTESAFTMRVSLHESQNEWRTAGFGTYGGG